MLVFQNLFKWIFLITLLSLAQATPANAGNPPVILVYGDSLSAAYGMQSQQGWVTLMQEQLIAQKFPHRVVNASVSGETTSGGLTRFAQTLQTHHPQWVMLELGANDGLRGLPIAQMRKNLASMIALAKQAKARVLLLGMKIPPNYGPKYTQQFHQSYSTLASSEGVTLLPFLLEGVAGNPMYLQNDGLHPNVAAQAKIMQNVWGSLKPLLQKK